MIVSTVRLCSIDVLCVIKCGEEDRTDGETTSDRVPSGPEEQAATGAVPVPTARRGGAYVGATGGRPPILRPALRSLPDRPAAKGNVTMATAMLVRCPRCNEEYEVERGAVLADTWRRCPWCDARPAPVAGAPGAWPDDRPVPADGVPAAEPNPHG